MYKAFKAWASLFWTKKKIYWSLLPHFFDQATDLGVILEFNRYNQQDIDIGINTFYLLWTSIGVLILHRIISSVAIYSLTRNKMDALLQTMDLLTVKCVWLSHVLGKNEAINPQRYLQILEAIFEVRLNYYFCAYRVFIHFIDFICFFRVHRKS